MKLKYWDSKDKEMNNNNKHRRKTTTTNTKSSSCPFQPKLGYATSSARREYIRFCHDNNNNDNNDGTTNMNTDEVVSKSLMADRDITKPLYFWQLYSLIGHQPIIDIVTDFYTRVYNDTDEIWFRNAFTTLGFSKEHHISTQVMYWVDAMGGGKLYHGGNFRLNFHHEHNAGHVMTAKGAKRWMYHMTNTIQNYNKFPKNDPRIKPCIINFLKTKMMKYAEEHDWEFDSTDFYQLEGINNTNDQNQQQQHQQLNANNNHLIVQNDNNKNSNYKQCANNNKISCDNGTILLNKEEYDHEKKMITQQQLKDQGEEVEYKKMETIVEQKQEEEKKVEDEK